MFVGVRGCGRGTGGAPPPPHGGTVSSPPPPPSFRAGCGVCAVCMQSSDCCISCVVFHTCLFFQAIRPLRGIGIILRLPGPGAVGLVLRWAAAPWYGLCRDLGGAGRGVVGFRACCGQSATGEVARGFMRGSSGERQCSRVRGAQRGNRDCSHDGRWLTALGQGVHVASMCVVAWTELGTAAWSE